jgi:hypothetical protein
MMDGSCGSMEGKRNALRALVGKPEGWSLLEDFGVEYLGEMG